MNGQYTPGDIVLGNWTLVRLIGEGSFGRVYEAQREDFGRVYKAAIKIITIPQSQSEIKSIEAELSEGNSVTAYFRGFIEELIDEFLLMSMLKGHSNVVSYEDHTVIQHTNSIGWDIIIRMELLTPLIDYVQNNKLTRKDVTQLGIDMCKALELCQKYNIVHRDIKPENIFVSKNGDNKLGDFGIARTVEKTTINLSKKGTYTYMAPEIYRGDEYGSSVDIYSLGLVLYRFFNDNRTPFLPASPAPISHNDRKKALAKRMSGTKLPTPKNVDGRLAEIIMKACAFYAKDRYSSPMQMRDELEAILYNRAEASIIYPQGDEIPIEPIEYVDESANQYGIPVPDATSDPPGKSALTSQKTEQLFEESVTGETSSVCKIEYDQSGNLLYKCEYDAGSDKIIRSSRFVYENGKLSCSIESIYDASSRERKRIYRDPDGFISQWQEIEFNGSYKHITAFAANSIIVGYHSYVYYDNGNVMTLVEYDNRHNEVRRTCYHKDATIRGWYLYERDAHNKLTKEIWHNENGVIEEWSEYEYDIKGNHVKTTWYNADGSIDSRWLIKS